MNGDAPRNGTGKTVLTILTSVVTALLLAGFYSLTTMWQKVLLQEERHVAMLRIDEIQSQNLQALQQQMQQVQRMMELMDERQRLNIKAVESASTLISTLITQNTEQQYQLSSVLERLRLLERTRPQDGP